MRKIIIKIALFVLFLGFAGLAKADIIELPLSCAGTYDVNTPPWTSDFDLEITFSEISYVYINWSGEITAGLAVYYDDPCNPFPQEVGIRASLGANPSPRLTEVWCGEEAYPEPETFDIISRFSLSQSSTWSDLLDGQGNISIDHISLVGAFEWYYIDYGSVVLDDATLIFDGTVIPEPTTILLLSLGAGLMVRMRHFRTFS